MTSLEKTIGIFGGGQLGMMLVEAAESLGFKTNIYCPDHSSPAFKYSTYQTIAEYNDKQNLSRFIKNVDFITVEFENIPSDTIDILAKTGKLSPPHDAIKISQDRLMEKDFFRNNNIITNEYMNITSLSDLEKWDYNKKSVIKTRQLGYDGKGQRTINSLKEAEIAFYEFGRNPCIMEEFVEFTSEISTISVRDTYSNIHIYPPTENIHKNHILETSSVLHQLAHALLITLWIYQQR